MFTAKHFSTFCKRLKFGTFLEHFENLKKNKKFKKNINFHISQQQLEIEQNGRFFLITCIVNGDSKIFFLQHFKNFDNLKNLKKK